MFFFIRVVDSLDSKGIRTRPDTRPGISRGCWAGAVTRISEVLMNAFATDRPTDRRTDGRMDRPTNRGTDEPKDGRTDTPSYRVAYLLTSSKQTTMRLL